MILSCQADGLMGVVVATLVYSRYPVNLLAGERKREWECLIQHCLLRHTRGKAQLLPIKAEEIRLVEGEILLQIDNKLNSHLATHSHQ